MGKVTLTDVTSGYSSATKINTNSAAIEEAFDNTLSRDGSGPNQMEAELDMNENRIINVPSPQTGTDVARYRDVVDGVVNITNLAAPNQAGNANRALFTDGSVAAWRPLVPQVNAESEASPVSTWFERTPQEIAAGAIPVNYAYPPYHAWRYLTSAQVADVVAETLTLDCADGLQSWLNASEGQVARLPAGKYKINQGLTSPGNIYIFGDGRESSYLYYTGATTIIGGALLKFDTTSAFRVSSLGFRCTQAVIGNLSKGLHLENCVYFEADNLSFGASGASSGTNNIGGLLCDQTSGGFVPPRGSGCIRNILYVVEPTDSGASSSRGVHIKGHPSQQMEFVTLIGEGDIEHAYYGVHFENCANCSIYQWQMRGATNTEIRLTNADNTLIVAPMISPAPAVGTGIYIDADCLDTLVINTAWNFSSGAPAASLVDLGTRTNILVPGAATGFPVRAKHAGSIVVTEIDDTATQEGAVEILKNQGYNRNVLVLRDPGTNPSGNKAFLKIERGSDVRNLIEADIAGVNWFRVDFDGNVKAHGTLQTEGVFIVPDGITAPTATAGLAKVYVDTADGDLKIIFGDGTIKTIVTDT